MNKLVVGFSRLNVDPMLGIGISGYFKPRIADGYLDSLEANVLVVEKGNKTVVISTVDIFVLPTSLSDKLKAEMAKAAGTVPEAVFVCATHAHTTPYAGYVEEGAPEDLTNEYTEYLIHRLVDATRLACEDKKEAKMGFAVGNAPGIAFVRRFFMKDGTVGTNPGINNPNVVKPVGETDEAVNVLRFDREGGETIVLANFGCHPDTVGGNKISADWPGFFRRTFEAAVENTKTIFINGTEGDINHVNVFPKGGDMNDVIIDFDDVPRGYGHARHMGRVVAGAVMQVYDKVEYTDVEDIKFVSKIIDIPSNMPTPEQLPEAHRIRDLHAAGKDSELPYEGMMLTTVVAEAERMCALENGPETIPMNISVISIGDFALVGIPGEPFNRIGVALKGAKNWRGVLPCALTNGWIGYFPMRDSYDEGGYEARSSKFRAGVAELIIDEGLGLLEELR